MGMFNSSQLFYAIPCLIPPVARDLAEAFQAEGYEVAYNDLLGGGADISLRKGGMFKAILGMKTALKVTLTPSGQNILAEASVGIFGQQAVPTAISMLFLWPVLLTQISGLVAQSKLDDLVMQRVAESIERHQETHPELSARKVTCGVGESFCSNCGKVLPSSARFCPECGSKAKHSYDKIP